MKERNFKKLLAIFICAAFITLSSSEMIMAKEYWEVSNNNAESIQEVIKLDENIDLDSNEKVKLIVQFDEKDPYKYRSTIGNFKNDDTNENFIKEVNKKKITEVQVTNFYDKVFNGVAINIPANKIEKLSKIPMVKSIYSDCKVKIKPIKVEENLSKDSKVISSVPLKNIDKLHGEGIKGKNIKIGILDTGIDYNHPAIKNAYKGGYDFIDNDNDPMETTYKQWKNSKAPEYDEKDENTYYTTHGTHVAGIIAGQGIKENDGLGILGVAPEAEIYAYRVLGPYGIGTMESIISGVEKAVEDGMDILNLSLGIDVNDPLYPTSIAINNATNLGVTVVTASGNNGSEPYTISTPGTAPLGITVGASNNNMIIPTIKGIFNSTDESYTLRLLLKDKMQSLQPYSNRSIKVVYCGYGMKEVFKDKRLNDSIALVTRGKNPLIEKGKNAKEKGALFTIVINDNEEEGYIPMYFGEHKDYPTVFTLPFKKGQAILSALKEKEVQFKINSFSNLEITKGVLLDFSSRGPVNETYIIKPEIVAPGANILSSVPNYFKGEEGIGNYDKAYERQSGTSMATAYVTGVVALILDKNKNYSPSDIKSALMNTADDLEYDYSVYEIGAGMIDAYEAVYSRAKFQVLDKTASLNKNYERIEIDNITSSLNFNENTSNQIAKTKSLKISNNSALNKDFNIDVKYLKSQIGNSAIENNVTIEIDENVTIDSMHSKLIDVRIAVPEDSALGYYEGYIIFTNKNDLSEKYQMPFAYKKI
ncbi:S8 family serine peptidase [Clostridium sp. UBA6640]|uniref:S8 family serine peptidase n=1 Tax=Clostridium sp. UBA6640 TaxID=1946370 RepID=UPI0025BCDAF2|nr:S8 family serine peptidase [Clostridium sp. UBA6640]